MAMKYAFFMGCTVPVRTRNYEISARAVAQHLDIELADILDFGCCGFPLKAINEGATLLLAARNLCLAEERGLDVCCVCSACTSVLTETRHKLLRDEKLRREINEKLKLAGHEYKGTAEVKHFSRILYQDIGIEKIKSKFKKNLEALTFAMHYGCHYLKPSEIYDGFDSVEFPHSLDELIEATGAQVADYNGRKDCCGGGVLAVDAAVATAVAARKLLNIRKTGADGICLVCPFCRVMYDDNQKSIASETGTDLRLPVLFLPQVLGLAMGIESKALGFQLNVTKAKDLLAKVE
jgi:heterodisulfide reductase subunit B